MISGVFSRGTDTAWQTAVNVSLYQAAAAMNANARWQESISDNLAAANLPGYKKQDVSFEAVQAGLMSQAAPNAQTQFLLPRFVGATNFSQGVLRQTGVSTDVAIDGKGFFEVQLPSGATAYTRDGEFHLSASGQLVTKQGYPVLGDAGAIQLDPSLGGKITIAASGEISQGDEVRGKLKVVDFARPEQLTQISGGFFTNNDPGMLASEATATSVRSGFLEGSNVSVTTEMANLIRVMRSFESNQRTMQVHNERLGKAISELGNPS